MLIDGLLKSGLLESKYNNTVKIALIYLKLMIMYKAESIARGIISHNHHHLLTLTLIRYLISYFANLQKLQF